MLKDWTIYLGHFKNGIQEGQGLQLFANGFYLVSDFKANKATTIKKSNISPPKEP